MSMDDLNESARNQLGQLPLFEDLQASLNRLTESGAGGVAGSQEATEPTETEDGHQWTSHPDCPNISRKKLPESFDLRQFQAVPPLVIWQAWHHGMCQEQHGWKAAAFSDVPKHLWEFDQAELQRKNISKEEAVRKRTASDRQLFLKMRWLCIKMDAAAGVNTDTETPSKEQLTQCCATEAIQVGLLPANLTPKGRKRRRAEISWVTVARVLQKKERAENQQQQQREGSDSEQTNNAPNLCAVFNCFGVFLCFLSCNLCKIIFS